MYVDGCPVVRNPATVNHGLTSLGGPWMLGFIGDVRITDRALGPREFMNA
jgi:hypothetical protein